MSATSLAARLDELFSIPSTFSALAPRALASKYIPSRPLASSTAFSPFLHTIDVRYPVFLLSVRRSRPLSRMTSLALSEAVAPGGSAGGAGARASSAATARERPARRPRGSSAGVDGSGGRESVRVHQSEPPASEGVPSPARVGMRPPYGTAIATPLPGDIAIQ